MNSLDADPTETTVNFTARVQQLQGGRWKTIEAAVVDETATLTLVRHGDTWLIDKFE